MSLFGTLMGDLDDDPIFGHHMRSMRQMNNLMSSFMGDPFSMLSPFDSFGNHPALGSASRSSSLMPFGFQSMPNINRLLNGDINSGNAGASFCSSSFVSMTQGPDGRPQVYQATSSTKTGPGGVRETRKTVQDSRTGVKKMAIGHHIGERAHIIEREQNVRIGSEEERQDFINLDEDEAEDFDKEFTEKAQRNLTTGRSGRYDSALTQGNHHRQLALPAPPTSITTSSTTSTTPTRRPLRNITKLNPRRPLRTPTSSPLALPSSSTSVHPHPYNPAAARRNYRSKKYSQINKSSPDEN